MSDSNKFSAAAIFADITTKPVVGGNTSSMQVYNSANPYVSNNIVNTLYESHRIIIDTDDRRVPTVWVITPAMQALRFHVERGLTTQVITAMVKVWIDLDCPLRSLHRPEEVWTQAELQ